MKTPAPLFVLVLLSFALLLACNNQSREHMENAGEDIRSAGAELNEATRLQAQQSWRNFRAETDSSIASLEREIAELRTKASKANKSAKERLNNEADRMERELDEQKEKLKQEEREFESSMDRFNDTLRSRNESFKREFRHDMDGLKTAVKQLFQDNSK